MNFTPLALAVGMMVFSAWALEGQQAISPLKTGDVVPFVVLTLRPHGFEPAKITVQKAPFIIHIVNRVGGRTDADFTIVNPAASQVHTSKATVSGADTWRILTLPKGTYTGRMSNTSATVQIEVMQ